MAISKRKKSKAPIDAGIPAQRRLEAGLSRRAALTSAAKVGIGAGVAIVVAGGAAAYFASQSGKTATVTQTNTSTATTTATSISTTTSVSTATSVSTSTATSVSTVSQTSNTGPITGGVATFLQGASFASLEGQEDPVTVVYTPDWWNLVMFEKLLNYDAYPSTNLIPGLATGYTLSADQKTITVKLQSGVKWHDGSAFTSADVLYSFNEYLSTTSGYNAQGDTVSWLASVNAPDAQTVNFVLTQPSIVAPLWLAAFLCPILPASRASNPKGFYKAPIGTGPFKFNTENDTSSYLSYVANPSYWGGAPYLSEVRWTGSTDASEILAGFEGGQYNFADAANILGTAVAEVGTTTTAHIDLQYFPVGQYDITMNTAETVNGVPNPFNNQTIRQAVCYGINWGQILSLYGGLYNRAYQPVTSSFWCFNTTAPKYDYNPTLAASMLASAGFEAGTAIDFVIYSGRLPSELAIVQASLQNLGFKVNLNIVDSSVFYSNYMLPASQTEDPKYPWNFTMQSNGVSIPDPGPLIESYLYSKSTDWNVGHYSNPAVDSLYEQAVASTDQTERTTLFTQLMGMFVEAAVYPGTYNITDAWVVSNNMQGLLLNPLYQITYNKAWLST